MWSARRPFPSLESTGIIGSASTSEPRIIIAIAYLFSLIATYLPARQASRIYPAEALRYE